MYLAYVDESGDTGTAGSRTYTLGCVLVSAAKWPSTLDGILGFRRFLRQELGVPVRAEIKANHLLQNGGPFRELGLSEHARRFIYAGMMRLQNRLGVRSFAVVINKAQLRADVDPFETAWTFLPQRLERLSHVDDAPVMVVHDEGNSDAIRKLARRARRFGTAGSMFGGSLARPFIRLIEDPVSRSSAESYFLQLADLNAYAAFRRVHLPPSRRIQIVHASMWDELGAARYRPANQRAGGPSDGIVSWPRLAP